MAELYPTVLQLGLQNGRMLEQKEHSAKPKKDTLSWNRISAYPLSHVIIYPLHYNPYKLSLVMRKPAFCICENKDADQLRGDREADQRLCFRYTNSTIPLLLNPKFQASSHLLGLYSSVCVRPGRKPRRPVISKRGSIGLTGSESTFFPSTAFS